MSRVQRAASLLFLLLVAGCAVAPGPVGYNYGYGYYDAYGADDWGWGPGYYVGPFHDHNHFAQFDRSPHQWRGFQGRRAIPSLASAHRGGGFRGAMRGGVGGRR